MKLVSKYYELPEKIQRGLGEEISTNFVIAFKTTYKPNENIPILWLVLHKNGILFCSTHTKVIYKSYAINEIDSVKIHKGLHFSFSIEIVVSSLEDDNFIVTIPDDTDIKKLQNFFKKHYQVI